MLGCFASRGLCVALVLWPGGWSPAPVAADWPQILGPERTGVATGEKLAPWPNSGPPLVWEAPLGSGYAGPVVAGGRVIVFHRQADEEVVEAWQAATGQRLWRKAFPASYRSSIDSDHGPRATPLVHGEAVYVYGPAGDLHALALANGAHLWSRSLLVDYRADEGYFGAGSSPVVAAGRLLVNVGGRGAGIVALDPATGKTVWQATDEGASYASPVACEFKGQKCAVFATRLNLVVVEAATGAVRHRFPFGQRGPTVNAATPLVVGDDLLLTASYGIGALRVRLATAERQDIWATDESLSSQYNTPLLYEGRLYGIHGREDLGPAHLRCVDWATGKVLWTEDAFGVAHLIRADDQILALKTNGELTLLAASGAAFTPRAKAQVASGLTRSLPALAGGRLYVRELTGSKGRLLCYQVGTAAP